MNHLGDITKIHGYEVPIVEVIIGGSPCQDLSIAGKRKGLAGERSGLFMDQIRVIKEMRDYDARVNARTAVDVRPRYMVWENVPGAFSSNKGEDFRVVLEESARVVEKDAAIPEPPNGKWSTSGCIMGDGWSIAWRVLDAQFWGVPQRRRRIALVADFGGYTAPEILFERDGVSGNSQESGTAREGTAGDAEGRIGKTSDRVKCLTPWDCQSKRVFDPDGVMSTYQAMGDGGANNVAVCLSFQERAGKPGDGKGILIQENKTGALSTVNNQAICYSFDSLASNSMKSANPHSGCREVEISKTLDCFDPNPSKNQGGIAVVQPAICIQGNCIDRADTAGCNGKGWRDDDISFTLNTIDRPAVYDARGNGDGETVPTITGDHQSRITDYTALCIGNGQADQLRVSEKVGALNCMHDQQAVMTSSIVRRLTPLECERLQGYPDGWTDIGDWTDSKGKKRKTTDGARYKALGNSIALPPWRFVLSRLNVYLNEHTMASLFDGIGGFPLIWQELNGPGKCLWASEIEEFPIAVTKRRL